MKMNTLLNTHARINVGLNIQKHIDTHTIACMDMKINSSIIMHTAIGTVDCTHVLCAYVHIHVYW